MIVGAVVGFSMPSTVAGVAGWTIVVFGVLFGGGGLIRRALRIELGIGEQLLLGAVAWVTISGLLLALGGASRTPLLVLAACGIAFALAEVWERVHATPRTVAGEDRLAATVTWAFLTAFLVFNVLAMVGARANPYDDQVAYVAFVKRLLDCGDLIEPFSFRRISAYGGQTTLQALAALRGDVAVIDLLDRGIFQWLSLVLVYDFTRHRRVHVGVSITVLVFLCAMWDLHLNSAAVWTGFAAFLGAYNFASREDLSPRVSLVLTFACCGLACTLRQNYLLPAGVFALSVAVFHLRARARDQRSWRAAWHGERITIVLAITTAGIVVLPYMVATFRASGTFLYPVLLGNANGASPLKPSAGTFLDELKFFVHVAVNSEPIRIWWLILPLMLLARDDRDRRPWPAFLIACSLGFVALVHSFLLSDAYNLWRYGWGYLTPLAIVFFVEVAPRLPVPGAPSSSGVRIHAIAAFLVWLALMAHFVTSRSQIIERFTNAIVDVQTGLDLGSTKYDPRAEAIPALQGAIPEGERIAVMLDDPWMLDYDRNRIVNLDLPGAVAPAPGLPSFTSVEHWRAYLRGQGIRYLAFSEDGRSTWLYRRVGWLWRIFADDELFRFIAARMVDTIDMFAGLAKTSKVLYHAHGLVAIDLGEPVPVEADRGPPEPERQDAFARRVSEQELGNNAWQLASRRDVAFQTDLIGPSRIVDLLGADDFGPSSGLWHLLFGGPDRRPLRYLADRTRVRVHGSGTHDLRVAAWLRLQRLATSPSISIYLDGARVATGQADAQGNVTLDARVSCTGWCDVYILLSTTSDLWRAEDVRVAKLLEFDWKPAP
ncbi:MAG: hypothetical protein SFX73_29990 [Kofleriaceae bacterium]|nr:hypothetical protein [Kofleriaceae bacterium]